MKNFLKGFIFLMAMILGLFSAQNIKFHKSNTPIAEGGGSTSTGNG